LIVPVLPKDEFIPIPPAEDTRERPESLPDPDGGKTNHPAKSSETMPNPDGGKIPSKES